MSMLLFYVLQGWQSEVLVMYTYFFGSDDKSWSFRNITEKSKNKILQLCYYPRDEIRECPLQEANRILTEVTFLLYHWKYMQNFFLFVDF